MDLKMGNEARVAIVVIGECWLQVSYKSITKRNKQRGGWPQPKPLIGATNQQGAALQPWLSPARATAGKSGRQQGQRRPRATALATGAAAHADGVQRRCLRRATAAAMAQ
ncbi:hypothetical protein GW17_00022098 [Ensete ventricosum]|nr:hypothetical protein GW17_00022098 [Ensete ventricosum]RZS13668.1 hypothetical protein BHM03_00045279 [Ensete ventricosum]